MKKITILLCVIWMGFIFFMSSNNGKISHEQSTKVVSIIENTKEKIENNTESANKTENNITKENPKKEEVVTKAQGEKLDSLDHLVRKNAHGFLYMTLAVLVSSTLFSFRKKGKDAIVYILFICQFYAVTDEFHQSFVPGRTSMVSDVLVDLLGAIIGIAIFYLYYYKVHMKLKLKKAKN